MELQNEYRAGSFSTNRNQIFLSHFHPSERKTGQNVSIETLWAVYELYA